MSEPAVLMAPERQLRAARLALWSVTATLVLGGAALGFGVLKGAVVLWGFGVACLLSVPSALSLYGRIRDGLGNRGLERERLTLRVISHLLRLLALGMAVAAVLDLTGHPVPDSKLETLCLGLLALGILAMLWLVKRGFASAHPSLGLDAARTSTLLELAVLLLLGYFLGRWFFWAEAAAGLGMALRLFLEGNTLAKGTTLPPACGGCGGGCGCG